MTGLDFWLRHVAASGGLWEPERDCAYVVLPAQLRDAYGLPEELRVTADPDVAREDGATLLAVGHPVLAEAADRVLAAGDAGFIVLDRPASPPPGADALLAAARDAFPVDHGRIDLAGEPTFVLHPVIRVGALVTYEMSAEDRFQEEAQRWVDVPSRRELPATLASALSKSPTSERTVVSPPEGLLPALGHAHELMDSAALARRSVLGADVGGAMEAERGRAVAYYADVIAGIERRLSASPPERRAVLEQRLRGTREEEARRLAEIAEKYQARHVIRPYRLHVYLVPALRVRTDVLRGTRAYPMSFVWLLPARVYAQVRCPSCASEAGLVASKAKLGCETCLPANPAPAAPPLESRVPAKGRASGSAPAPGKAAAAQAKPAPTKPAGHKRTPAAKPAPAKKAPPVPPQARKEQGKAVATLAERLWSAVAAGDRRSLAKLLHPVSPAAALHRVYGPAGFAAVIGMSPGEAPDRYTARVEGDAITGALLGSAGAECQYFVGCRDGLVAEVVPFPVFADGHFWNFYWWGSRRDAGRVRAATADLDVVERALVNTGTQWNGLPVALRALAAWDRIGDAHGRLLPAHDAPVVAACVIRLVAYRAGGKAPFAGAAGHFRVPEQEVRRVDRAVRPLLALGPGQPW